MARQVEELKTNLKQKNKKLSGALLENKVLVSENKKLKKRLTQAESLQKLFQSQTELFNSTNVFLTYIDKNYRYIIVNNSWCDFIGKNRREVIGKKISTFWGKKEFNKEIKPRFDKALIGNVIHYQHWLKNVKGENCYFNIEFHPFYRNRSIEGVLVTSIDITDRIRTEETLRISELRNRTLVDAIPDIMFRVNRDGTFLDYKTKTEGNLYVPSDVFLGKKFSDVLPAEIARMCLSVLEKTFKTKQLQTFEYQLTIRETPSSFEARVEVVPDTNEAIFIIRDITERTEYEIQLKKERDTVVKILESMSDAFVALDKNWCYTYMNEKAGIIFNRTPKEIVGKHIWTEFPEGIGQSFHLAYEKAMRDKTTITLEEYYPPYNKWFENYIYPVEDGLQIFFRDITERKEITLKIENERKRLQTLIETIPDPMWVKDPDGVYLLCNPAYEMLFGHKASEIIGKTDYDVVPQEVADMFRKNDMDALKENKSITYFEEVRFVGSERRAFFESIKTPMYDAEGNLIGTLGIAREVTKLIEVNKELQKSESRYRQLFEHNPAPMLIYERSTLNMLAVNEAFENHYGYNQKETLSMHLTDLYPEEERDPIVKIAAGLHGYHNVGEWHHRRKDGSLITIIARSNDLMYEGHTARVAVLTDVTERKIAEEKIKTINVELEERVSQRTKELADANRDLESFAYSISHDLRAPLRHIDGFTRLLKNSLVQENEDTVRYYNKITESSVKMSSMIDALLTFSRLGRKPLKKTEINLNELVAKAIKHFEPDIENRNIEWRIGELPTFYGDHNLMQLVLENLISNAIKFTSKKEKAIIEIAKYDTPKSQCGFYIKDNGAGFDNTYTDKLFGVFQRLHTSEEFEGTGIGLANIKQIINRHGGTIRAEGEMEKGATFYLTF